MFSTTPMPPVYWVGPLALTSTNTRPPVGRVYVYLSTRNTASSDGPQTYLRHMYIYVRTLHHNICGMFLIFTIHALYRKQTNGQKYAKKIKIRNKWWWCILISMCLCHLSICERRLAGVSAFIVHSGHHIYTAGKCDYMTADRNRAVRNVYAQDKRAPPAGNLRLHTTRALDGPHLWAVRRQHFFWSEILSSNIRWYTDVTANIPIYMLGTPTQLLFFIVVCAGSLLFECCGASSDATC